MLTVYIDDVFEILISNITTDQNIEVCTKNTYNDKNIIMLFKVLKSEDVIDNSERLFLVINIGKLVHCNLKSHVNHEVIGDDREENSSVIMITNYI